jgi:hypothetical protein
MTLQEVIKALDDLSPDELRELRAQIEQREWEHLPAYQLTPVERAQRLNDAFERFREGLTQEQLDEISAAMNAEY